MADLTFRPMTAPEIASWYRLELSEAFAENERKPLPDILALVAAGRYEPWGLFAGGRMVGYAALWRCKGIPLVLLDYLGVSAALRSGGLGSMILARLREGGFPIVTESELPVPGDSDSENALRLRRIGFYRRNGFAPAYEMATCGMRWQALLAGADGLDPADVMAWHRALYGPERTDVRIPLGPDETPEPPYWMV
ncbi:MAG: GNAT family N-acetyltransferase [Ruminococcaceae bacterium]|nr:GNAT family N-acetyltransferase [Oscillospiraceae bacterium]